MPQIFFQMTIEQLLVQCFYQNKKVGLQNIGSFELIKDVQLELNSDKIALIPEGSIQFMGNAKEPADEALVIYIKDHTKKMHSLAHSDLESYTSLQREMIYLGKALFIPGIGTLHKSDAGNIEFTQGKGYEKISEVLPERKTAGMKEDVNFDSGKTSGANKKGIFIFLILLLALIVGAVFYFVNTKKKEVPMEENKEAAVDSSSTTISTTDSSLIPAAPSYDNSLVQVVIRTFKTDADAQSMASKFKSYGHNTGVIMKDSSTYLLTVGLTNPITDTTKVLDSLNKLFEFKTYIYQ